MILASEFKDLVSIGIVRIQQHGIKLKKSDLKLYKLLKENECNYYEVIRLLETSIILNASVFTQKEIQ